MEDEVELRIPIFRAPPNNYFVYYDDEGNITDITNEKKGIGNYLEKSHNDVIEFLDGKKHISNFQIKILEGQSKIFQKSRSKSIYKDLFIIEESIKADCLVKVMPEHLVIRANTITDNDNRTLKFFIVDSKNLNFLIKTITVSFDDLNLGKKIAFYFDIKKHKIVTKKFFNSYGIIYNDKKN